MAGIVSEGRKPCQPRARVPGDDGRAKKFLPPTVRHFKIVVYCSQSAIVSGDLTFSQKGTNLYEYLG